MSYPAFGTATIKCAKRGCKWEGLETQLAKKPSPTFGSGVSLHVCPRCGCDSYRFTSKRPKQPTK